MRFDGSTYSPTRDRVRLSRQYWKVWSHMSDGYWHSLYELSRNLKESESGVSARLRDMRKERFGANEVERKYAGKGSWLYRLIPSEEGKRIVQQAREEN